MGMRLTFKIEYASNQNSSVSLHRPNLKSSTIRTNGTSLKETPYFEHLFGHNISPDLRRNTYTQSVARVPGKWLVHCSVNISPKNLSLLSYGLKLRSPHMSVLILLNSF